MYLIPGTICIREDRGIIREDHKNCLYDKRKISSDKPSACREEMGNVFVKTGVMVKAGIPPSISEERVCKVVQKTDLKWTHFQRNRILIKSELKKETLIKRKPMVVQRVEVHLLNLHITTRSRIYLWMISYLFNKFQRSKWEGL